MKIRGMPDAPETVWLRLTVTGTYYHTSPYDEPDAVRYVRADLYDVLVERMRTVRSWCAAPNQEPLGELEIAALRYLPPGP